MDRATSPDDLASLLEIHERLNASAPALRAERGGAIPADLPRSDVAPIVLPPTRAPAASLAAVLGSRRSVYDFSDAAVPLDRLGSLLGSTVGVARHVRLPDGTDRALPFAPTAGGLRTLDVHVVARRVTAVPPGVWRYDPDRHRLVPTSTGDPTEHLALAYLQAEFADRAPATLVLVARAGVALATYPPRHYRTLHVEAGVAAQSIALVATGLGLGCCMVAGYRDDVVAGLLALDVTDIPMLLLPVGIPRTIAG